MSEPFIAEVRIFAGNFAPRGWAFCQGQLLPISQNSALFSLVGTTYGGDGRTTFGLPNMVERAPMHPGNGPGLTPRRLGERVGVEQVALAQSQIPSHQHQPRAGSIAANSSAPAANSLSTAEGGKRFTAAGNLQAMDSNALSSSGGGQPHNNMQPFISVFFIIALTGLFPSRS